MPVDGSQVKGSNGFNCCLNEEVGQNSSFQAWFNPRSHLGKPTWNEADTVKAPLNTTASLHLY